jgi:hypothetical protein
MIRKTSGPKPFVLMSSDGKRVLGRHKTRADAEAQERAIQAAKHARKR